MLPLEMWLCHLQKDDADDDDDDDDDDDEHNFTSFTSGGLHLNQN